MLYNSRYYENFCENYFWFNYVVGLIVINLK